MNTIINSVMNKRRSGELIKKKRTQRVFAACLTVAVAFFTYGAAPVFAADSGVSVNDSRVNEIVLERVSKMVISKESTINRLFIKEEAKASEIENNGTIYVAEVPSDSKPIFGIDPAVIIASETAPTPNGVAAADGVTNVTAEPAPGNAESGVNAGRKSVTVSNFVVGTSASAFARVSSSGNQVFITSSAYETSYDDAFKGITAKLAITGYESVSPSVTVGFSFNGAPPVQIQSGTISNTDLNREIPLSALIDKTSGVNVGDVLEVLARTHQTGTVGISLTVDGDYYPDLFKVELR
jgi:hypothetical protein